MNLKEGLKHHKEKNDNLMALSEKFAYLRDFYNYVNQTNPKVIEAYKEFIGLTEEFKLKKKGD